MLAKLQRLWLIEAVKYNVLPLDDRGVETHGWDAQRERTFARQKELDASVELDPVELAREAARLSVVRIG